MSKTHIIIDGSPVVGFEFTGPFGDANAAQDYMSRTATGSAWVAPMRLPVTVNESPAWTMASAVNALVAAAGEIIDLDDRGDAEAQSAEWTEAILDLAGSIDTAESAAAVALAAADKRVTDAEKKIEKLAEMLREAIEYKATEFDGPDDMECHVGGADTVDFLGQWRDKAKAILWAVTGETFPRYDEFGEIAPEEEDGEEYDGMGHRLDGAGPLDPPVA